MHRILDFTHIAKRAPDVAARMSVVGMRSAAAGKNVDGRRIAAAKMMTGDAVSKRTTSARNESRQLRRSAKISNHSALVGELKRLACG